MKLGIEGLKLFHVNGLHQLCGNFLVVVSEGFWSRSLGEVLDGDVAHRRTAQLQNLSLASDTHHLSLPHIS